MKIFSADFGFDFTLILGGTTKKPKIHLGSFGFL